MTSLCCLFRTHHCLVPIVLEIKLHDHWRNIDIVHHVHCKIIINKNKIHQTEVTDNNRIPRGKTVRKLTASISSTKMSQTMRRSYSIKNLRHEHKIYVVEFLHGNRNAENFQSKSMANFNDSPYS